jgi:hypothetical protein
LVVADLQRTVGEHSQQKQVDQSFPLFLIHILNGLQQQVAEQTLPSLPPEKEHFTRPKQSEFL